METARKIAPVVLSEYDPQWPSVFEEEKQKILEATSDQTFAIEHIGSTSIPGTTTKPEIDIMIGVPEISQTEALIHALENIGYIYFKRFEEFAPERRYLRKSDGLTPLFHIHMVEENGFFWRDRLIFRDYMRNHPSEVERYSSFKKDFISKNGTDRQAYSEAKKKVVDDIIETAQKSI
jgi:GrpB-like predicted nucleotidyltransferase (UPF0157 family)